MRERTNFVAHTFSLSLDFWNNFLPLHRHLKSLFDTGFWADCCTQHACACAQVRSSHCKIGWLEWLFMISSGGTWSCLKYNTTRGNGVKSVKSWSQWKLQNLRSHTESHSFSKSLQSTYIANIWEVNKTGNPLENQKRILTLSAAIWNVMKR